MNLITANTTNHRRAIMFVAALLFGVFTTLVFYRLTLTIREVIISAIVGLAAFEFLFRTRKWLRLNTLPLYIIVVFILGRVLFSRLFELSLSYVFDLESRVFLFTIFPYELFSLFELSIVTGIAYFLIKIYRQEGWEFQSVDTMPGAGNEQIGMPNLVTDLPSFLRSYQQQIIGFLGWHVITISLWLFLGSRPSGFVPPEAAAGEGFWLYRFASGIVFLVTIFLIVVLAIVKPRRKIALGILWALAFNFVVSLVMGLMTNGLCFIPFIFPDR